MEARDKPSIGQSTSDEEKHRMVCNNSISSPAQSNLGTLVRRPALNDLASTPGEPFPLRGVTTDDSTAWWPHPSIHPSDPPQGAVGNPRIRPAPLWHPACRLGAVPAWWVGSYTHGRCGTRGMFVSPLRSDLSRAIHGTKTEGWESSGVPQCFRAPINPAVCEHRCRGSGGGGQCSGRARGKRKTQVQETGPCNRRRVAAELFPAHRR